MNKKLLALAVAGACVAPAAMAQTANPVTLYGRVYVSVQSVKADNGPSTSVNVPSRMQVSDDSSLLGVRGTEDIGGGNKVFFQLETAFPPDQNATSFATRNSAVGLQGGWGSILAGRWDSPYKVLGYGPDIYGDLNLGGITAALHGGGYGSTIFDVRMQNVVQYWTPNLGGFQAKFAQTANETKTAALNQSQWAANLTFAKGPIALAYGHEEHKDTPAAGQKQKGDEFTAEFTISSWKLAGIYEELKQDGLKNQKNYLVSVLWTVGKHQLGYQYENSKDGAANTVATQPSCDVNSAAYFYNWSKRSQLVATYTKVDNKDGGACKFGSNSVGGAGQDKEGFGIGIRHLF